MNTYALHGFLGRPEDWSILSGIPHHPIDLFNTPTNSPENGLEEWSHRFNSTITTTNNVLLGYSLGGRIALHALVNQPSTWNAAIIVSAHSGFTTEPERNTRRERDCGRAEKFEKEPWDSLMDTWDSQPLFCRSQNVFKRNESDYNRKTLSSALRNWSMSEQRNLKPLIEKLHIPILWIAGEHDPDYKNHADTLTFFHPQSRVWIAPNSGHRVPWEITGQFLKQLKDFLEGVQHAQSNSY